MPSKLERSCRQCCTTADLSRYFKLPQQTIHILLVKLQLAWSENIVLKYTAITVLKQLSSHQTTILCML